MMTEHRAALMLNQAVHEGRAAELIDALFNGGSFTVDDKGNLIIIDGDMIRQLSLGSDE